MRQKSVILDNLENNLIKSSSSKLPWSETPELRNNMNDNCIKDACCIIIS